MQVLRDVKFKRMTPQLKAFVDHLVEVDQCAVDIALGEYVSISNEGMTGAASKAENACETWLLQVIGDATFGELLLQDPVQSLCAARDRLEENDRPLTRSEWREIHAEDRMDDLRARGGV